LKLTSGTNLRKLEEDSSVTNNDDVVTYSLGEWYFEAPNVIVAKSIEDESGFDEVYRFSIINDRQINIKVSSDVDGFIPVDMDYIFIDKDSNEHTIAE
jgi:hypothetical protein